MLLVSSHLPSPAIFISSATYSLLASAFPRLLFLLRTPLGWWGGGCGSSSYPHGQVTDKHAVWSTNVVHHACPSNPLCCRHLLGSISHHLSYLLPHPFPSPSSFPRHLLFLAACTSPPRHLAISPSGLFLLPALGRFGGCPPLPGRHMVRSIERQRCLLAASGQRPHIYGIGCCSPPHLPTSYASSAR